MSDKHLPLVEYNDNENLVWSIVYDHLIDLYKTHACKEFNESVEDFQKNADFRRERVPQLDVISSLLQAKTGWRLRPVGGLLSQREFLNSLAFRVFSTSQYIRHHTTPFYTPEPDIIHELFGHAPMLAVPDFADFS